MRHFSYKRYKEQCNSNIDTQATNLKATAMGEHFKGNRLNYLKTLHYRDTSQRAVPLARAILEFVLRDKALQMKEPASMTLAMFTPVSMPMP